jgi:hypothetical protein
LTRHRPPLHEPVVSDFSKCPSHVRCHHLFKTFHAGPAGWVEQQLPDGTIVWTSPRERTYITTPTGALFFPQLGVPTGSLILPNSPPPGRSQGPSRI